MYFISDREEYILWWKIRFSYRGYKVYKRFIRPWDISTSGESSFRQKGYAKKTKNQASDDWRQRKGFSRDQAKGRCWCKCKINDARAGRRAWERDCIRKQDWDQLASYNKNTFTSAWDCC